MLPETPGSVYLVLGAADMRKSIDKLTLLLTVIEQ